ncbi:sigma 54-interacting transcriptional regulator [bacterium]|nr:sigma 54-interacting transcriptional regulator [bacterium]
MNTNEIAATELQPEEFIGSSPQAKRIRRAIKKFSKVNNNILIIGDTGTGKKLVASQIHTLGRRKNRPFVNLNCSALGITTNQKDLFGEEKEDSGTIQRTIGILERANRGILYLENVGEMSPEFQFELLQVFKEGKFRRIGGQENISLDVRILASNHEDLEPAVEAGEFRKDLYYELNSLFINLPTLKEIKQDIPELFIYLLKRYCRTNNLEIPAVPAEMFESILEYDWKGNVLELKNCVDNLVMMSPDGQLSTEFLPFEIKRHPLDFLEVSNLKGVISDVETHLIKKALGKFAGNQVKAARLLGIPEATLRFKMKKYAIPRD